MSLCLCLSSSLIDMACVIAALIEIGNLTAPFPYRPPVLCITGYRACNKTCLGPLGGLQLLNLSGKFYSL